MPETIGVRELKNHASRLLRAVREDMVEYVVTLRGEPVAVLRPLTDEEAQRLFQLARQTLNPTGRLVTIDPCFASGQSVMSRMLVSCDRGDYVRHCEQYEQLARREFRQVQTEISHSLLRIPYTHVVVECRKQPVSRGPRAAGDRPDSSRKRHGTGPLPTSG